ncbi:hypothetical protein [Smaragdicoccus niigatensis]|nr:hypothetical protein [Smaragdicoccus niigatensis]
MLRFLRLPNRRQSSPYRLPQARYSGNTGLYDADDVRIHNEICAIYAHR